MSTPDPHPRPEAAADGFAPIADHSLLADCIRAALVDPDGSISWLCPPRYNSAALFARILDPGGGHSSIAPTGRIAARAATCWERSRPVACR